MAAAYAALVSLLNTMDQIQIHPLLSTSFDKYQNESLREKVDFFLDFVENHSDTDDLVGRIAFVAHVAEDIIERQVADRIRDEKSPSLLPDLHKIIQDMDSIKKMVIKAKEETGFITYSVPPPPSSSAPLATAKTTTMVGFDGYLLQLLDELTGNHSGRRILPIVGMGGIGKTTLARNVYDNLLTVHHFDVRVWVTLPQEYSASEILLQALSCLGESTSKTDRSDDQLGEELYKKLLGMRYLIVLDDVWSVEAWEEIKFFFPENNNRSRIVITTRQSELVDYFGSSPLALDFLDDKNSWELFCEETFGCPSELEEVGKKIVKKCKGLPLAIVVIGGLLGKSPRKREYWLKIEKDIRLILNSTEGSQLLNILSLSYKHLPVCLKSCFLHLGLFPEDHEIDVSALIKLWVAEGFIKPNSIQSLEEIAESLIKDLVDRKLLLVRRLKLNRKFKSCCVHDVVRDMCIRIGEKENFFCVERGIDGEHHFVVDERMSRFYPRESQTPSIIRKSRLLRELRHLDYNFRQVYSRFLFHESPHVEFHTSQTTSLDRNGQRPASFKSRLLRVLDNDMGSLDGTSGEVNIRFLYHQYRIGLNRRSTYELPSSISRLWGLQTLIIKGIRTVVAPSEIWKMPQLRHIEMWSVCLPDPLPSDDVFVLQNLHTLREVKNLILTEEVCKRIPNIKDLHIHYDFDELGEASSCYHLHNVGCLNKLESLHYSCWGWEYAGDSLQNLKLPSSLKELTLRGCHLVWNDMAMIGSLPHLEILELLDNAVVGGEWNCVEEEMEFRCLKHLEIDDCDDLVYWIGDGSNFPVLETLFLRSFSKLDEIPSGIGEIPTLETMFMFNCNESAIISAVEIVEEQESLGNHSLQLQLKFWEKTEGEMWRDKIEELGFTCQNLLIHGIQL